MDCQLELTHKHEDSNGCGVIFLLNKLPLYYDIDEEFPGTLGPVPYGVGDIAATYFLPLGQIFSSRLNAAGFIRNIFANFGPRGCCELNPNTSLPPQLAQFVRDLSLLFRIGLMYDTDNGEVACRMILDLSSLMFILPANSRIIGCIHGPGPLIQGPIMDFRDYLRAVSDDQTLVFVIGELDTTTYSFIDDYVLVSNVELDITHGLAMVLTAMEMKYGL